MWWVGNTYQAFHQTHANSHLFVLPLVSSRNPNPASVWVPRFVSHGRGEQIVCGNLYARRKRGGVIVIVGFSSRRQKRRFQRHAQRKRARGASVSANQGSPLPHVKYHRPCCST